jgi:predicted RNA binding protein YcfA (HicA-like mRNA interferase family)
MGKRLGTSKEVQSWADTAERLGWRVEITGGNHIKFMPPRRGEIVIVPKTGSYRCELNVKSRLRRAGLPV